jgi:hypothetical protein
MPTTEKPSTWLTWEQLLAGVETVSLINEPIDECVVDFEVAELTPTEKAQQRWRCEVIVKHGG